MCIDSYAKGFQQGEDEEYLLGIITLKVSYFYASCMARATVTVVPCVLACIALEQSKLSLSNWSSVRAAARVLAAARPCQIIRNADFPTCPHNHLTCSNAHSTGLHT